MTAGVDKTEMLMKLYGTASGTQQNLRLPNTSTKIESKLLTLPSTLQTFPKKMSRLTLFKNIPK